MQNANITIPKAITKGEELVIITRREYDNLRMPETSKKEKRVKECELSKAQKEALRQARLNMAKGNFLTLDELKQKLGSTN